MSLGVLKISTAARSRCMRICRNDGLLRGLALLETRTRVPKNDGCLTGETVSLTTVRPKRATYQHCFMRSRKPSGQVVGMGKCRLLLPTPQMIALESTSLYGVSQLSSSHMTTPYDLHATRERAQGRPPFKHRFFEAPLHLHELWNGMQSA